MRLQLGRAFAAILVTFAAHFCPFAQAEDVPIYPERPNVVTFSPQEARFVRLVIRATAGGVQPCIDELEVYGPDSEDNLALAVLGAKPSASSCLTGYAAHAIQHLNDGQYGNSRSWIPASTGEQWAQVELAETSVVARVVFSRDRLRQYGDRVPVDVEVRLSLDGQAWQPVARLQGYPVTAAITGAAPPLPPAPPPPLMRSDGWAVTQGATDLNAPRRNSLGLTNLALLPGASVSASSVYEGGAWSIHQIRHLADGLLGNDHSWISDGEPSWAQVDLGRAYWVCAVAFGSDSGGRFRDRAATAFTILVAEGPSSDGGEPAWMPVFRRTDTPPVHTRTEFRFAPVRARLVRLSIWASVGGECRVDELEVYGSEEPIPLAAVEPLPDNGLVAEAPAEEMDALLRAAFVGEEHAWLKTFGRADLDPTLVPYNGRVQQYPRHVGDDRLPLPPLPDAPVLDGRLDDPCWQWASRGVVRVAQPDDFVAGPLVTHEVFAGRCGEDLCLALRTDRLLSAHIAVLSALDWAGCGVLAFTPEGIALQRYAPDPDSGQLRVKETLPVQAAHDASLCCCEVRIPLAAFPGASETGLRVGLGMGGRHVPAAGRPVEFVASDLAVAEAGPCLNRVFRLRLAVAPGREAVRVRGNVPSLERGHTVLPGQPVELNLPGQVGPIGPELNLKLVTENGETFALHLFRYDPLERTLNLMTEMLDRMEARGLDVAMEREELAGLRQRQGDLLAREPYLQTERETLWEARLAKRRLFLRDPDLEAAQRILFVKRHPYHPSHIYTDYTDAPFRPGGGVCVVHLPWKDGRLHPEACEVTTLFHSGGGIARDAVPNFDLSRIYFGYRPSADGFYHLMCMNADGSELRQLTDGPYHDFYPLPLPDGGLAFITTRCAARVFCFRWTASVLYRMDADGGNMRPLSHASLSEWAPSLMRDGRILWTRWEYIDKGADFTHTLWAIRPDGSHPELVFGNTIIQPNGYAVGRQVPGTDEISCVLVSHFGDINGPVALLDIGQGRMNPAAIHSITPEVPWPGMWPATECFRDPLPLSRDLFLCSHAPWDRFGLFVIDRYGNRELLYMDPAISSMGPVLFRPTSPPPVVPSSLSAQKDQGEFLLTDVYRGLEPAVERGRVKFLRVVEEVRHDLRAQPNFDHADFMKWYAAPVDIVSGPYGWPTYTAKADLGLVPVERDGSARFRAPAGKVLYFQALDADLNELQRMRSVVQLQAGEIRGCIGCHESRSAAPPFRRPMAFRNPPRDIQPPSWGAGPFSFQRVVQPVLDARCARCHDATHPLGLDLTGTLDSEQVPASYRTLISRGLVHVVDCGWNSGGCEKREPLTFGTLQSPLWRVLNQGHYGVQLTWDEMARIKCWTDLNCPLWPDYVERGRR